MEEIQHHLGCVNNGINYLPTDAGFQPSTVSFKDGKHIPKKVRLKIHKCPAEHANTPAHKQASAPQSMHTNINKCSAEHAYTMIYPSAQTRCKCCAEHAHKHQQVLRRACIYPSAQNKVQVLRRACAQTSASAPESMHIPQRTKQGASAPQSMRTNISKCAALACIYPSAQNKVQVRLFVLNLLHHSRSRTWNQWSITRGLCRPWPIAKAIHPQIIRYLPPPIRRPILVSLVLGLPPIQPA